MPVESALPPLSAAAIGGNQPMRFSPAFRFDVGSLRPGPTRISAWTDTVRDKYYAFDMEVCSDTLNVGRIEVSDFQSLRVGLLECDPMRVVRRANHIGLDTDEYCMIPFAASSPLVLSQRGQEAALQPGDLGFIGTGQPYSYHQPEGDLLYALRVPAKLLRDRIPLLDDLTARRFDGRGAMVTIFRDFVQSCLRNGDGLQFERLGVLRCMLDLFALAVSAPGAAAASEDSVVCAAHRSRALAYIERNFARLDLSSGAVSAAIGVSPRYLQRIFSRSGESVSGRIRQRRIAEACRLLASESGARLGIKQVAFDCGFRDLAHFSRSFRAETGLSPSAYRESAASAAEDERPA